MSVKVKTCGFRRLEDIEFANKYSPDYVGCIRTAGFKRSVTREDAISFRKNLNSDIPLVGVFVDEPVENIINELNEDIIDIAQLHGKESEEDIKAIKSQTGKPVWKVFRMNDEVDYKSIEDCSADMVLLDAGAGSGKSFDWSLVENVKRPFVLAGGLTNENVAAAIEQTHPFAVDTSSGIETDNIKDEAKIAAYIEAARRSHNG